MRLGAAGTSFQAGVPLVGSTRVTVSDPTAKGGRGSRAALPEERDPSLPAPPPQAVSRTAKISAAMPPRRAWHVSSAATNAGCRDVVRLERPDLVGSEPMTGATGLRPLRPRRRRFGRGRRARRCEACDQVVAIGSGERSELRPQGVHVDSARLDSAAFGGVDARHA